MASFVCYHKNHKRYFGVSFQISQTVQDSIETQYIIVSIIDEVKTYLNKTVQWVVQGTSDNTEPLAFLLQQQLWTQKQEQVTT